jgi:hypothetical protein
VTLIWWILDKCKAIRTNKISRTLKFFEYAGNGEKEKFKDITTFQARRRSDNENQVEEMD